MRAPKGLLDEPPAHTMAEVGPFFKGQGDLVIMEKKMETTII